MPELPLTFLFAICLPVLFDLPLCLSLSLFLCLISPSNHGELSAAWIM